jgi:acetyl-CoA carboxylase biotin carboxylase subunit
MASTTAQLFKRVLIANRGEIAVRIIRSLRELGIESVALYATSDRHSAHVRLADYAYPLDGSTAAETYLNLSQLKQAILESKADALHPGYGFLSESPALIALCEECGITFIGPSQDAIHKLGDKIDARALAHKLGIPTVPGHLGKITSAAHCEEVAQTLGFPLIIKAAAGGGGRGMRVVTSTQELASAYASCTREAEAYFGDSSVFCERYLVSPRHIEMQVLVDHYGNGIHLGERDCSIQRRHQKLCEEAPSVFLSPENRERMGAIAVSLALAAGFVGTGTVEFICESPEQFYFMEMNPRIQVEHPITEMICGIDLIAEQIRVAAGFPLSLTQADICLQGYALEARINAEDPRLGFMPTSGRIRSLKLPGGPFTRIDSHLYQGYEVPTQFDSLLAKICVWGRTREEARRRMLRCLSELELQGLATTAIFHEALLSHPRWQLGEFSTNFIPEESEYFQRWFNPESDKDSVAKNREYSALSGFLRQWQGQQFRLPPREVGADLWRQQARRQAQERI